MYKNDQSKKKKKAGINIEKKNKIKTKKIDLQTREKKKNKFPRPGEAKLTEQNIHPQNLKRNKNIRKPSNELDK